VTYVHWKGVIWIQLVNKLLIEHLLLNPIFPNKADNFGTNRYFWKILIYLNVSIFFHRRKSRLKNINFLFDSFFRISSASDVTFVVSFDHNVVVDQRRFLLNVEQISNRRLLEVSRREVAAFDGDVAEQSFLICFLQNVFFDRSFADESVNVNVASLTDSVTTILKNDFLRFVQTIDYIEVQSWKISLNFKLIQYKSEVYKILKSKVQELKK